MRHKNTGRNSSRHLVTPVHMPTGKQPQQEGLEQVEINIAK